MFTATVDAATTSVVMPPVADAYVQGGSYANHLRGDDVVLQCKTSVTPSYTRESFLRFDLSSITNRVVSATLRLKVSTTNGAGDTHAAYLVGDDTWIESTLSWHNKPAIGALMDSAINPNVSEWLELDVTGYVENQRTSDGLFSTAIVSDGEVLVSYHSREGAVGDRPQLVVYTEYDNNFENFLVEQSYTTLPNSWTFLADKGGDYQIGMAWIAVVNGSDAIVEIFKNESEQLKALYAPSGEVTRFEMRIEGVSPGDTITVKVTPGSGTYRVGYQIAFGTPTFVGLPMFDVASYGAVGDGVTDDYAAIQNAVIAAKTAGGGIVTFDGAKTYRVIGDTSNSNIDNVFDLEDTSNIKMQGNGATLMLRPPDKLASIRRSENIQVDGFVVDYDPYPYYQGTITNIDVANRTIDITVPARYSIPAVGANTLPDSAPFFGRYFVPDGPGLRTGSGENIYIESMATNGDPRQIRLQVPEKANGVNMQPRLQNAVDDGATEMVVPDLLYGQRGNYTILVTDSARVTVSNILMYQAPHYGPCPMRNVGPVTFSNVDLLMKNPETELYWSWRGGYSYVQSSRWGYMIEDGDWHASAFYDDLFAFFTRRQDVMAVSGKTLTLEMGESAYLYAAGDWVSIWTEGQTHLRGMLRITAVGAEDPNGYFEVTLESHLPGIVVDDVVINEELYNRDTIVRNCTSTDVGTKCGTTRLRTTVHFIDCDFEDVHLSTEFDEQFHPTRARSFVLEDSVVGSVDYAKVNLRSAINPKIINTTLDGTQVYGLDANSITLDSVDWINMIGDIIDLDNSRNAWLFGSTTRNGNGANLANYVTVDGTSSINYVAPANYPPSAPPSSGPITLPTPPVLSLVWETGGIALDWTDVAGAARYTVYRSSQKGGPYESLLNTTASNHIDINVIHGNDYYYVVTAIAHAGNASVYSNEIVVVSAKIGVALMAVADAYVKGGSSVNGNYGLLTELKCKTDNGNETFSRESYLRFDLSALSGHVVSAHLRLKVASTDGDNDSHGVHFVSDDSWGETTIKWNNKPAAGALLDVISAPAFGEWLTLDLLSQVTAELGGDQVISAVVISDGTDLITYHSREAGVDDQPQLVVVTSNVATPVVPTGLVVTHNCSGNAMLDWADQSGDGVVSYGVYRSATAGGSYTHLINTDLNHYVDSDIVASQTYVYAVTAINGSGLASGMSSEATYDDTADLHCFTTIADQWDILYSPEHLIALGNAWLNGSWLQPTMVPKLMRPIKSETVYLTIPYLEWTNDGVKPCPGHFTIQIDDAMDFTTLIDEDTLPAFLNFYSPDFALAQDDTYYWRVRYIDENGFKSPWSDVSAFTIGHPYVVDVLTSDDWSEIQTKFTQVADYGNTHLQAGELRFPINHSFSLTQDPADDYLLYEPGKDNFIINGRGSTLTIRATIATVPPRCGFLLLDSQDHIQVKDITIDYENDSLCQFGGVISNLDKNNDTFTVTVDPAVYGNFTEAAAVSEGYALSGAHQQNITSQGVGYDTVETWAQADQGNNTYNFTGSTGFGYVRDALNNGDYFVSAPVPDRGGDIISLFNNVTDFVANNVTTLASRGRYFVARGSGCLYARSINNHFIRSGGRIMGSASGGVNHFSGYGWYENNTFEYTRDDAVHIGGGEAADPLASNMVFRNNTVTGAFRNSCWVHTDRSWITGNTIAYAGNVGINISGQSQSASECRMMDVGLIENNQIIHPAWRGIMSRTTLDQGNTAPDPVTGYYSQYLTIINNTITDHQKDEGMFLTYLKDCTVSNNTIENTSSAWSVYTDPALQIGIYSANAINVSGIGNIVTDTRIDPSEHLVIDNGTTTNVILE